MTDLYLVHAGQRKARTVYAAAVIVISVLLGPVFPGHARAAGSKPAPAPAAADGRVTFGIKPSHATLATPLDTRARFEYTATPGAVQPDYIAISNFAATPLHLSVYASDAFNTDSDGFDLLPAAKKPVDIGSWITLKVNAVDIKPGGTVVIPFVVKVPAKVAPGDHDGGIVASLRSTQADQKGDQVSVDHRVGVRVYMRVQGPLDPRLAVSDLRAKYRGSWWNPFAKGKLTVSYVLTNPGNVRLGAHQSLSVAGWYGTVDDASVNDVSELLPGNSHSERVVVSRLTAAFHEKATVTVAPYSLPGDSDGRLTTLVQSVSVWAIPWGLIILLALIAMLLIGAVRLWRRRRTPTATAGAPVESDHPTRNAGVTR